MSLLKDFFAPALAGIDDIENAKIPPQVKLELLDQWRSPSKSRRALKALRETIAEIETDVAS